MTRRGRGRPPYPEILTPAEQRVLQELRKGGTNAEIAARLDVTLDAVKYHISNMLGKLEFDNREQLAAWRPERRRVLGFLALPATLESLGRPLAWAGATLAGAVVVAIVLIVLASLDGSGPKLVLTPAPTPRPDLAVQVSAGSGGGACAVRESGRLICWPRWPGTPSEGTYRSVSVGSGRACAIEASGAVVCWAAQAPLPESAPPGLYSSVSVGESHACAVRDSGEVVCWWDGEHGKADAPPGSFRAVSARDASHLRTARVGRDRLLGWHRGRRGGCTSGPVSRGQRRRWLYLRPARVWGGNVLGTATTRASSTRPQGRSSR